MVGIFIIRILRVYDFLLGGGEKLWVSNSGSSNNNVVWFVGVRRGHF